MTRQGYSGWKDQNKESARRELKSQWKAVIEATVATAIIVGGFIYIAYIVIEEALPFYVGF